MFRAILKYNGDNVWTSELKYESVEKALKVAERMRYDPDIPYPADKLTADWIAAD